MVIYGIDSMVYILWLKYYLIIQEPDSVTNPKSSVQWGSLVHHRSICQETGLFEAEIDEILTRYGSSRFIQFVLFWSLEEDQRFWCRKIWSTNLVGPTVPTIQLRVLTMLSRASHATQIVTCLSPNWDTMLQQCLNSREWGTQII